MDNQKPDPQTQSSNDPGMVLPPVQYSDDAQQSVQPAAPQTPPPMPAPAAPVEPEQPAAQTVPDSRALVPTPEAAADSDLIEKEWVEKAKQIVEHTAEDPFNQQEALSKMKADYLKKRYNKDLGEG